MSPADSPSPAHQSRSSGQLSRRSLLRGVGGGLFGATLLGSAPLLSACGGGSGGGDPGSGSATSPGHCCESIRVTIEHGHANKRSDDFSSVAYWYQALPHCPFDLPAAAERTPFPT